MKTIDLNIKEKKFPGVYLLYGEEVYLKRQYRDKLLAALTLPGDTMNFSAYQGKDINPGELIDLAETLPFFAEKRVILVEDSGFFKTTCDALAEYFPQVNETTCFIFVESEVDKRNRLYKKVKELGYAAEMERQDPSQLASWAGGILAGEGKKITAQTMELLLEKTGDDMENIRMELEKLVSYTLGRDVITASDVEEICTTRITSRVFNMVEAITEGNVRKALDLYEDLLALKEEPRKILPLIGRQFNQIFQVKELMSQGMNRGTIGSALKLKPYIAGKLMNQARAYSPDRLRAAVNLCTDTEEAVKTGQLNDRMAVELLITGKY